MVGITIHGGDLSALEKFAGELAEILRDLPIRPLLVISLLALTGGETDEPESATPPDGTAPPAQDPLQNQGILIAVLSAAIERYQAERR